MSVIAGLIRFSQAPVYAQELETAAARLHAPRVGEPTYWVEDSAGLLLRQRIATPEDMFERQPWIGGGGKLVLVYDGRIDNREELAAALCIALNDGVVPDGRLLLLALERWGEAALPRLIGDFALALWDKQNHRLLLARDQMGGRSLFYHQGAGFVAFATTYPALLGLPGVPKTVDERVIADLLISNNHHPEQTFYAGIHRVPSASFAVFDGKGSRINRYWTPEPKRQLRLSSDEEYAEAMREQLDRAVSCRLRAKGQVASMMTGGLDSSAVAATAARLLAPNRLVTVTSVPPEGMELPALRGWYNDERPFASAIAALHPNMDMRLVSTLEPHWIETDPAHYFAAGGMPIRNASNLGWLVPGLEMIAAEDITVLLNGEGGNGAWSWNGLRVLNKLFRQGRWISLARELHLTGRHRPYGMNWKSLLRSEVLQHLKPTVIKHRGHSSEEWAGYSAINPEFAREIDLVDRCHQDGNNLLRRNPADGLDQRVYMLGRIGRRGEAEAVQRALTGVEARAPLLDIRLLEFCLSIPQEQFLKDGIPRRLTRSALADRLPPLVLENRLLGKQNPEIMQRMGRGRANLIDELEELKQIPLAARCLDLPRLVTIVRDWPDDMQVTLALPCALNVGRFLRWAEQQ